MNKSIKSVLTSVSVLLLFMNLCAGGDFYEDYSKSLFVPEVANVQPQLKPFYRSDLRFYVGKSSDESPNFSVTPNFKQQNVTDWVGYFDNKIDKATIQKLLYETAKRNTIDSLIFYIKDPTTKIGARLKKNAVGNYPDKNKSLDFLYYLGFALSCESFNPSVKEWDTPSVSFKNNTFLAKLIAGGQRQGNNVKDPFVKERYCFQNVKLLYYNEDYAGCESYYEANKSTFTISNSLKYRALGYVAASLYKRKLYAKANYYYGLIFENCEQMMATASWSFHPQEEADWQKTLSMATTADEKATLWFLMAYNSLDNLRAMREIVKIAPNSPYLDLLLTRAINDQESTALDIKYDRERIFTFETQNVNNDLLAFVEKQCTQRRNAALWHIGAGYLNLLKGDLPKANSFLAKTEELTTDALMLEHIRLYKTISHIQQYKKLDTAAENDLLTDLKWLYKTKKSDKLRVNAALNWAKNYMASLYRNQGEDLKAECWVNHGSLLFYEKIENLERMEAFLKEPNPSPYSEFIKNKYDYKLKDIYEAQAVAWTYLGDIDKALSIVKTHKISLKALKGDPFLIHIKDCHDCDHQAKQAIVYNGNSFLEKLQLLINKGNNSTKPDEKSLVFLSVANGFYNISYNGNGRAFYDTEVDMETRNEFNNGRYDYEDYGYPESIKSDIFSMKWAKFYYQKALASSQNPEMKAKCIFMLAKCEQNDWYLAKPKDYKGDFKAGANFAALKANYSNTNYYKEIIKECGYFRTYLAKKK
jgi:hypothetical protein